MRIGSNNDQGRYAAQAAAPPSGLIRGERRDDERAIAGGRHGAGVTSLDADSGDGAAGTHLAVHHAVAAAEGGSDALMIMPPTFFPVGADEIFDYYTAIDRAVR